MVAGIGFGNVRIIVLSTGRHLEDPNFMIKSKKNELKGIRSSVPVVFPQFDKL